MEAGRGKAPGTAPRGWDSVCFDGLRYPFLFGLKLSNDFDSFRNCGSLAFHKLGQHLQKNPELGVRHAFFHFLTSLRKRCCPLPYMSIVHYFALLVKRFGNLF